VHGCYVVGVVGADYKVEAVRELGADAVIDKHAEPLWNTAGGSRPRAIRWCSTPTEWRRRVTAIATPFFMCDTRNRQLGLSELEQSILRQRERLQRQEAELALRLEEEDLAEPQRAAQELAEVEAELSAADDELAEADAVGEQPGRRSPGQQGRRPAGHQAGHQQAQLEDGHAHRRGELAQSMPDLCQIDLHAL
jgi:hypothetical protein